MCTEGNCGDHSDSQRQRGIEHKKLQAEIKKAVKRDRHTHVVDQFRENPEDKHKKHLWKAIKAMKSKFTPRYIQMKNRKGTLVPLKKKAEAIADYLENSHWSNPTESGEKEAYEETNLEQVSHKKTTSNLQKTKEQTSQWTN